WQRKSKSKPDWSSLSKDMKKPQTSQCDNYAGSASSEFALRLEHIFISGIDNVTTAQILEQINVKIGVPILALDIRDIKAKIDEISWVKESSVYRQLPNALHISIIERQPLAIWQNQGSLSLIDLEGRVIDDVNIANYHHMIIAVGEDVPYFNDELQELVDIFTQQSIDIKAAILIGNRRWNVRLDNNIEIKLPEDNIKKALDILIDFDEKNNIFESPMAVIDVRLPDRITLEPLGNDQMVNDQIPL
ncbi:MAG: FtsQ-type POTRA domain-containing protein, partial [Pseudomonadota bacterium]